MTRSLGAVSIKRGLPQESTYCKLFYPLRKAQESELACNQLDDRAQNGEENEKLGKMRQNITASTPPLDLLPFLPIGTLC